MKYEFTLPMPPSINETYRTRNNYTYKTRKARDWEEEARVTMLSIFRGKPDLKASYEVTLAFYFFRDRDIDSGIKILLDFLQSRFYDNDRQIIKLTVSKHSDKDNPRVEIQLESV